jgi:hypothetical protein
MSEVRRICALCGEAVPLEGRYCARCGYDFESALPAQQNNLPINMTKAALPVLAGAATLALRAGWKLAQSQWARDTARNFLDMAFNRVQSVAQQPAQPPAEPKPTSPAEPARRARRTIHIRSSWAEGDAKGVWRQGTSEHKIEIDD